ncbi:conserved hypothetical protein [Erythrobacter sp. EC-HK427]|nr:conserved hypothetical protein [Erythrobacter sp. EC-HK427]
MILPAALLALVAPATEPMPFLTMTRSATGLATTQIEIGVLPGSNQRHYWFRRVESGQGEITVNWTDSQSCEGSRDTVVVAATQVSPPEVAVPGIPVTADGSVVITLDGVQYSFEARSHYAGNISSSLRFTSNVGTPLADYVEDSILALEPCWSEDVPGALQNWP